MSNSRTGRLELKNFFGGPILTYASEFSGAASILTPDSGRHLRVYKVLASASGDNSDTIGVQVEVDGALKALLYVPAGGVRELAFDGRYLRVDTALEITRADATDDAVAIFASYADVENV